MSGIGFGQAISIIGGSPILKNVLGHTVDGLKIPRHIDVGNVPGMSSIMSGILSGGPSSLLQSPLGSTLSSLISTLTTAQASVTAAFGSGGQPLTTAIAGVSTSAATLSNLADNLIGFASNAGLPTQFEAIGHANLVQSLGTALPASMSLATVLAPTSSVSLLSSAQAGVQSIVAQVTNSMMSFGDGQTAIEAIQAGLDAVTNASTGAIASLQTMAPALAAGQATVALLVNGPPEMAAAIKAAIRPDQMAAVQAIVDAHNETLATAASTQNAANAAAETVAVAIAAAEASAPTS